MNNHWKKLIPNFEQYSYYAGVTSAFAEVVGAGVKQLALSHPYSKAELDIMLEPSKQIAAEYGVFTMIEDDLIVTKSDADQSLFLVTNAGRRENDYKLMKDKEQQLKRYIIYQYH